MDDERRKGDKPVPDNIKEYLNDAQLAELHTIESFGWQLKFIRRPLFMEKTVIIMNPEGSQTGVLEEDGRLNLESNINLRDD